MLRQLLLAVGLFSVSHVAEAQQRSQLVENVTHACRASSLSRLCPLFHGLDF
jgi:hypothetical protein